ncbi:MAG: hypothetical protein ABWX90_03320 [Candidatus Saccharimonadales bacterium]
MNDNRFYMELSDGFEFIYPANEIGVEALKFLTAALYDLDENRWLKYRGTFTMEDGKVYQYREEDESARRKDFSDVPVMGNVELATAGYMSEMRYENIVRHRFNMKEFGKRVRAFKDRKIAEGAKFLYVDEESVRLVAEMKEREAAQERGDIV